MRTHSILNNKNNAHHYQYQYRRLIPDLVTTPLSTTLQHRSQRGGVVVWIEGGGSKAHFATADSLANFHNLVNSSIAIFLPKWIRARDLSSGCDDVQGKRGGFF